MQVADTLNQSRVFLCPSRQEGFGLTGLESIFCGCVLVTTDCYGIREYADENNTFMCHVDDEQQMFNFACKAFDDNHLCVKKRTNCLSIIRKFNSDISKEKFKQVIMSDIGL